jgi:preprotein translocase subunit YajC
MLNILLETVAPATIGGINVQQIAVMVGCVVVFYFFMIRPQQKRQKEQRGYMEQIKKGDFVVTIGGIHGKIESMDEDTVTLEIDQKGSKITIAKNAIAIENTRKYIEKHKKSIDTK